MTDGRQHAESRTLQPCRTAAAVGNTIYVRVACPRYAAASCLCRSLSFVTPPLHTFLLYIGTFKNSNTAPGNLYTNQPILINIITLISVAVGRLTFVFRIFGLYRFPKLHLLLDPSNSFHRCWAIRTAVPERQNVSYVFCNFNAGGD